MIDTPVEALEYLTEYADLSHQGPDIVRCVEVLSAALEDLGDGLCSVISDHADSCDACAELLPEYGPVEDSSAVVPDGFFEDLEAHSGRDAAPFTLEWEQ